MKDVDGMMNVYEKLKKDYQTCVTVFHKEDGGFIMLKLGNYRVEASNDKIDYYTDNKMITHTHFETYEMMYEDIVVFLDNPELFIKNVRKTRWKQAFILIICWLLFMVIYSILQ